MPAVWPTQAAPSANNWTDHFPGSSLNGRWSTITSGTGAVTVTDSYAQMDCGGTSAAAAIYLNTQLDLTKSWLMMVNVSATTSGTSGFSPYMLNLCNGASAPVADTHTNWNAKVLVNRLIAQQDTECILDQYFTSANAQQYWDGTGTATWGNYVSTAKSQLAQDDDYYVLAVENDAINSRWRLLGWHRAFDTAGTYTQSQGWRMFSLSNWTNWSSTRSQTGTWLVIGAPFNDDTTTTHKLRVEWVKYIEPVSNAVIDSWTAAHPQGGSPVSIRHNYSYDGAIFVPDDRTTTAIATGASYDTNGVQEPWCVYDGNSTDYLFYTGVSSGGTVQAICVATATHAQPQPGPWTKFASNPIISVGASGANDDTAVAFAWVVCDKQEPDPAKLWKMLYSGLKALDNKWRLLYATASSPTGTWTKQGLVLDVGGVGTNDETAARDAVCVWYNNQWYLFYEAWNASKVTCMMYATGTNFLSMTKQGTFWSPLASSTDQALTASMTSAPGRTVTVASTTGFQVDAGVAFSQSTSLDNWAYSKIRKIVNSTTIELYHGITGMTTSYPARIKQMDSAPGSSPRNIIWNGTSWVFYINQWEPFFHTAESATYAAVIEEGNYYTHNNVSPIGATPTINYLSSPTVSRGNFNNDETNENMTLMNVPIVGSVADDYWIDKPPVLPEPIIVVFS